MKILQLLGPVLLLLFPARAIGQGKPGETRPGEGPAAEWRRLERLAKHPGANPDELWDGLVALRRAYPDSKEAARAAGLLLRVPSPLDQLDQKQIPAAERFAWQPEGVAAVLGEHAARHWEPVTSIAFASGGAVVVSRGVDGLRVWDTATMKLKLWHKQAEAFALSPDGKLLAVGETRGVIRVYVLEGDGLRERLLLRKPNHGVDSISFAPGGQGLAAKYTGEPPPGAARRVDRVYVLWDWSKGKPQQEELPRPEGAEPGGRFTADGNLFIHPVGEDRKLYLWNVGPKAPGMRAELRKVADFALSPDGKMLAGSRVGNDLTLWDITAVPPKELLSVPAHGADLKAFSPDGRLLAGLTGFDEDSLLLWSVEELLRHARGKGPPPTPRQVKLPFPVRSLSFAPDGQHLALGGRDGSVRLWDLTKSQELFPPRGPCGSAAALAFSADGRTLAVAGGDGSFRLWDLGGGKPRERFLQKGRRSEAAHTLAVAPGGDLLALLRGRKDDVEVWGLATRSPKRVMSFSPKQEDDTMTCLLFDPSGSRLLLCGQRLLDQARLDSRTLLAWWGLDLGRGKARPEKDVLTGPLTDDTSWTLPRAAVTSPDGRRFLFVTIRAVHLWEWDGAKPKEMTVLAAHNRIVTAAFSPDGSELVTCGEVDDEDDKGNISTECQVRMWGLAGGRLIKQSAWALPSASKIDYVLGGNALLMEEAEQCVLRDKRTGKRLWQWKPPAGHTRFAVAPDRRHVALANSNGTIYIVRLKGPDKP